jgi:myo-inositol-1(or 4)-monophosphatase
LNPLKGKASYREDGNHLSFDNRIAADSEISEENMYKQAQEWVMEAGRMIKTFTETDKIAIQLKTGHTDLVTEVDRKVESWFVHNISVNYPEHSIVGEENINNRISSSKYVWIIDPIDGTTNMINRNADFAISSALCKANEPVFGIVYNVMGDHLFSAVKGNGAYFNQSRLDKMPDQLKLENELISLTLPWHEVGVSEEWSPYWAMASKARGIRVYGATTIELCDIALRRLGAYVQYQVKAWDYAAARVILEELGCKFTDLQGRDINWEYNGGVVAAPPDIHKEIMELL